MRKLILIFSLFILSSCAITPVNDDPLGLRTEKKDGLKIKVELVTKMHRDQ